MMNMRMRALRTNSSGRAGYEVRHENSILSGNQVQHALAKSGGGFGVGRDDQDGIVACHGSNHVITFFAVESDGKGVGVAGRGSKFDTRPAS